MPLLWRYLLRNYLWLFLLSLSAFVGMLLVVRFQEIATFACSGSRLPFIALFTFYQIPYILPFAIPISSLIAALILFRNLSNKQAITTLRAAGFSLRQLKMPLLLFAVGASLLNFVMASEVAPVCKALSKNLIYEATTQNPLFAFQKDSPIKINNANIQVGSIESDHEAETVNVVFKNASENRLVMVLAKKLFLEKNSLVGKNVSVLSYLDTENEAIADHLVIENQERMDTEAHNIAQVLQTTDWNRSNECLGMRHLLAKLHIPELNHQKKAIWIELFKRLSLGMAPFGLTLLGSTFGIKIGRHQGKKNLITAATITALFLMTFLAAKSIKYSLTLSALLYFVPHLFLINSAFLFSRKIERGVE